jgi:uracil phosphoribosyltransferase
MAVVLNAQPSVANEFLRELRDQQIQQNRMLFRTNLERLGNLMAYEISKKLDYRSHPVATPLGTSHIPLLSQQPVLLTVLRAGLPYFQGFQNFFDRADCGFIGAYRKESSDNIAINLDYLATPSLEGKVVILVDPMLATGKSFIKTIQAIAQHGTPAYIHIASLVASPEGIAFIEKELKLPHTIWTWAQDEKLNDQFYIVPGLGDAGDLCFGEKL